MKVMLRIGAMALGLFGVGCWFLVCGFIYTFFKDHNPQWFVPSAMFGIIGLVFFAFSFGLFWESSE